MLGGESGDTRVLVCWEVLLGKKGRDVRSYGAGASRGMEGKCGLQRILIWIPDTVTLRKKLPEFIDMSRGHDKTVLFEHQ